ncbi:MAG: hypothetical protein KDN18_20955 [Verrucomicrobiae bacterium]|nr:hypothetical protein [Verrucomicrobiae bacterium]
MNDTELDDLIRHSHPEPEFPATFQRDIWTGIAVAESRSLSARWTRWSEGFFGMLARPAPALASVAVMLVAGATLGHLIPGENHAGPSRERYLASIDPLRADTLQPGK